LKREERLSTILELLAESGQIEVEDIVRRLAVSPATARRDLDSLAAASLLSRTHGGAVSHAVAYDLPVRYQKEDATGQKHAIAVHAASLVSQDMIVGLSGGTTASAIATQLGMRRDLVNDSGRPTFTVVTNAVNIASLLAVRTHVKVMVTGGMLNPRSYELVGPFAEQTLEKVTLDVAFVGINGLEASVGPTVSDDMEAAINNLMIRRARQSYLVCDSSKIGHSAFVSLEQSTFTALITDSGITDEHKRVLIEAGIPVIVADPEIKSR
jgi:DeoR family transcriptional regulator of aga operon